MRPRRRTNNTALLLLSCKIDLHEDILHLANLLCFLVDGIREFLRVHGLDDVEYPDSLLRLVCLQVADEVPFDCVAKQDVLLLRFLDAAFPDNLGSCRNRLTHGFSIVILRYSNKPDIVC